MNTVQGNNQGGGEVQPSAGSSGQATGAAGAGINANSHVINLQAAGAGGATQGGTTQAVADPIAEKRAKFQIPPDMQKKYPELIDLVVMTESMTDDERQYWFQIMPVMSEQQLLKFQGILETERKQLQKLDQEYEAQLQKLNQRHVVEWQEFESREKRREIHEAEKSAEAEEQQAEEDLLNQLDNL